MMITKALLCLAALVAVALASAPLTLDKTRILSDHNGPRSAYGVTGLVWDTYLEANSQAWANACVYSHSANTVRGQAYATSKGVAYDPNAKAQSVGENLAANAGVATIDISGWVNERPNWVCSTNACATGQVCGHYTQVIWMDTIRLGCGATYCTTGTPFGASFPNWNFLVCRYNPAGNWVGEHPLRVATQCSYTPPPPPPPSPPPPPPPSPSPPAATVTWTNVAGYQNISYSTAGTSLTLISGTATTGTGNWSARPVIRTLPASLNPNLRRVFLVMLNNNVAGRVDVLPATAGLSVQWIAGGASTGFVSLDNIVFSRLVGTAATYANSWSTYSTSFSGATYQADSGAVYLSGLVKNSAATWPTNKAVFMLPSGSRPQAREIFAVAANNVYARVDVLPAGNVSLMTSATSYLSLNGIKFRSTANWTNAALTGNWATYTGFAAISSSLDTAGNVFVRGAVQNGNATTLGTLATAHKPANRRTFVVACSAGACRIDVTNTGSIVLVGRTVGTTGWPTWVSLSGIVFRPTPVTNNAKRSTEAAEVVDMSA